LSGKPPAELLGDLKAHRLRTLGVVWAQVHVDKAPVVLLGDLRTEAVAVVVVAVDSNEIRAVDLCIQDLRRFEIGGYEDVGLEAKARRARSDRVGQVAGRGAADGTETELDGVRQRHGHDAVLEAERGQAYASFLR
jgi:hypothetical protein